MGPLVGIGLIFLGILGLFALVWVVRTAITLIGNIVAGAVAIIVAGFLGIQVPITVLTTVTVIVTGLPGAMVLIGVAVIDPSALAGLTDRFTDLFSAFQ